MLKGQKHKDQLVYCVIINTINILNNRVWVQGALADLDWAEDQIGIFKPVVSLKTINYLRGLLFTRLKNFQNALLIFERESPNFHLKQYILKL